MALGGRWQQDTVIGSPADDTFYVGRYWDEASGFNNPVIGPKMQMPGTEPIVVIGRNRSGKDAGLGNYNALRLKGRTWWMYDPRGEGAAVPAAYRATLGPTYMINPAGLHADLPGYQDLRSHGRNPLLAVDWNSFFLTTWGGSPRPGCDYRTTVIPTGCSAAGKSSTHLACSRFSSPQSRVGHHRSGTCVRCSPKPTSSIRKPESR
jgi:hypothetical protein